MFTKLLKEYSTVDDARRLERALDISPINLASLASAHNYCKNRYLMNVDDDLGMAPYEPFSDSEFDELCLTVILASCQRELEARSERSKLSKLMSDIKPEESYFVTIGFDGKLVTDETETSVFCKVIDRIMESKCWSNVKYSCEKFTSNGIHRHIHFVCQSRYSKAKIIQFVQQYCKGFCQKNFIDVKVGKGHHDLYVEGLKSDDKVGNVEKDRVWRELKNIPSNI